jgi:transcription elongation factor GreA-like protein
MDIDKIFGLFDNDKDTNIKKQIYKDISEHPSFWVGMFIKLIMNHTNFNLAHISVFKAAFPDLDMVDVINAGEYLIYTRSYVFLKRLDIEQETDLQVIKDKASNEFLIALKLSLSYFEEHEEYEKCAFILSIKNIVEQSLT